MTWVAQATKNDTDVLTHTILNQMNGNIAHMKEPVIHFYQGFASFTTTSTSFVSMGANFEKTFTPSTGARILCLLAGCVSTSGLSAAGDRVEFDIELDGARLGDATVGLASISAIANAGTVPSPRRHLTLFHVITGLSVTSHTIKFMWRTTTGTARFAYSDFCQAVITE